MYFIINFISTLFWYRRNNSSGILMSGLLPGMTDNSRLSRVAMYLRQHGKSSTSTLVPAPAQMRTNMGFMLIADVSTDENPVSSSALFFTDALLQKVRASIDKLPMESATTWGDLIFCVFSTPEDAIRASFALLEMANNVNTHFYDNRRLILKLLGQCPTNIYLCAHAYLDGMGRFGSSRKDESSNWSALWTSGHWIRNCIEASRALWTACVRDQIA